MRAGPALLAALLAALPWSLRADAPPACAQRCRELAQRGELREGLSEQGCMLHLCRDEARHLYREGKYERAFAALELVKPRLVTSPGYQMDRGLVEYARGHFEEALFAFDHVLASDAADLRAGAQRAHTLVRLGRLDEARAQLDKLLELPASITALQGLRTTSYLKGNLGAILLMQGQAAGARAALTEALEIDRANTLAATYLYRVLPALEAERIDGRGVALMMLASEDAALLQLERARGHLDELLGRAPRFAEAYHLQADVLRTQQQYAICEQILRRGETQLPDDPSLRAERLRCQILGHGGRAPQALVGELEQLGREHAADERVREILLDLAQP